MAQPEFEYTKENFVKYYTRLKAYFGNGSDGTVDVFLRMLSEKTPFALSRFNDGEMSAFKKGDGERIGRTQHTLINQDVRDKLSKAMMHRQENYWVGMPCSVCFPDLYEIAKKYVGDYELQTRACVLTNRNWAKFVLNFPEAVKNREIHWVGSSDQNLQMLTDVFGIKIKDRTDLPNIDAWDHHDCIKDKYQEFKSGSVVAFSCGPMSRILAPEWFEKRPDVTFIDIGSVYDPFTRNVWHACHRGWASPQMFNETRRCSECN